jgi:hypothetical protein
VRVLITFQFISRVSLEEGGGATDYLMAQNAAAAATAAPQISWPLTQPPSLGGCRARELAGNLRLVQAAREAERHHRLVRVQAANAARDRLEAKAAPKAAAEAAASAGPPPRRAIVQQASGLLDYSRRAILEKALGRACAAKELGLAAEAAVFAAEAAPAAAAVADDAAAAAAAAAVGRYQSASGLLETARAAKKARFAAAASSAGVDADVVDPQWVRSLRPKAAALPPPVIRMIGPASAAVVAGLAASAAADAVTGPRPPMHPPTDAQRAAQLQMDAFLISFAIGNHRC